MTGFLALYAELIALSATRIIVCDQEIANLFLEATLTVRLLYC